MPFPIRFTVVSWPARNSRVTLSTSSVSDSMSPSSSAAIMALSRSSSLRPRFHAMASAMTRFIWSIASKMASACWKARMGSSTWVTVCDQARSWSRSPSGMPSISEITVNGSGKANSLMRSTGASRVARSSKMSSTSSPARARICSTARGVKALETSLRRRVWSGGSMFKMARLRRSSRPSTSPASCWRRVLPSPAMLRSSTLVPGLRRSAWTSSQRVIIQVSKMLRCTGSCSRSSVYCS